MIYEYSSDSNHKNKSQKSMEKFVNLEESEFKDLRNRQNYTQRTISSKYSYQNLPTNQDQIEYKIYKNFAKIDQKKFEVASKEDQKIIDQIIKAMTDQFKLSISIQNSFKFRQLGLRHAELVIKYMKQENPQCVLISFRLSHLNLNTQFQISVNKILSIADKSRYPLLMMQLYPTLCSNQIFQKKSEKYLEECLKAGIPQAFIWKAVTLQNINKATQGLNIDMIKELARYECRQKGLPVDDNKANQLFKNLGRDIYEMLKNAESLGYQPVAYKYLGQLFMKNHSDLPKNFKLAEKYFNKARQLNVEWEPLFVQYINQIEQGKKNQLYKLISMKSTEDTQAVHISNYLKLKMYQYENDPHLNKFQSYTGTKNNICDDQLQVYLTTSKTFYVVFSPLMGFPGRHFLAKDQQGIIQYISIYDWECLPVQKMRLLHQIGTKIILKQYIRKLGRNDQMPVYRVENPFSVEIYPRTEKYCISDKQMRNFAKNLFNRNLLDKAMTIYKYLIMKRCQQPQIVYSNMGLIQKNNKNYQKSIQFYQKSLKIKKYQKAQLNLAQIFIKFEKYQKAEEIISQIQNDLKRKQLHDKIQSFQKKQKQVSDFSKIVKVKHRFNKIIVLARQKILRQNNPSCSMNLRQDKLYLNTYKRAFQQLLGKHFGNQAQQNQAYLDALQKLYDSVQAKSLTKLQVQKFCLMAQTVFKKELNNDLYPYALPYTFLMQKESRQKLIRGEDLMHYKCGIQQVNYMSMRQNYLQNRIEDLCIELEQKNKYKQAQQLYRYCGKSCAPFNVKIAQLLNIQYKYNQCEQYCDQMIQHMLNYKTARFFKYITELIVQKLKALINLKQYKKVIQEGQKYIKSLKQNNPQCKYENYNARVGQNFLKQEKQYLQNGTKFIRNIYKQVIRALICQKLYKNAKQYIEYIIVKKQATNPEMIQYYYQTKMLQLMILKNQDPKKCLEMTKKLQRQVNTDQELQSKECYSKYLLKLKLQIQLSNRNIHEIIKLSVQIVNINEVNLIFIKDKFIKFIYDNLDKTIQFIQSVQKSQLNIICQQISENIINLLQNKKENKLIQTNKKTNAAGEAIQTNKTNQGDNIEKILNYLKKLLANQETFEQVPFEHFQQKQQKEQFEHSFNLDNDIQIRTEDEQFYDKEADKYENQICRFKTKNNIVYIVIFDQKLINSLQKSQYKKFICAADRICPRQFGSTGIKIFGKQVRLKPRIAARLVGKVIEDQQNKNIKICYFNKRESHNAYKRKK